MDNDKLNENELEEGLSDAGIDLLNDDDEDEEEVSDDDEEYESDSSDDDEDDEIIMDSFDDIESF